MIHEISTYFNHKIFYFQTVNETWKTIPTRWRWSLINIFICHGVGEAILSLLCPFLAIAYFTILTCIKLWQRATKPNNNGSSRLPVPVEDVNGGALQLSKIFFSFLVSPLEKSMIRSLNTLK